MNKKQLREVVSKVVKEDKEIMTFLKENITEASYTHASTDPIDYYTTLSLLVDFFMFFKRACFSVKDGQSAQVYEKFESVQNAIYGSGGIYETAEKILTRYIETKKQQEI